MNVLCITQGPAHMNIIALWQFSTKYTISTIAEIFMNLLSPQKTQVTFLKLN
jgi:hypothetical protein